MMRGLCNLGLHKHGSLNIGQRGTIWISRDLPSNRQQEASILNPARTSPGELHRRSTIWIDLGLHVFDSINAGSGERWPRTTSYLGPHAETRR